MIDDTSHANWVKIMMYDEFGGIEKIFCCEIEFRF